MSRRCLLIVAAMWAISMVGVAWYAKHQSLISSKQAVEEYRAEDIAYWKQQLVPLYEASEMKHEPNPKTREEVFGPLLKLAKFVK